MLDKVKEWLRWVYDWITVLSAVILGIISQIDTTLLGSSDRAMKIVTAVAVVKAVAAYVESRKADA